MNLHKLSKLTNPWRLVLVAATTALTGGIAYYGISHFGQINQAPEASQTVPAIQRVIALGRLEPEQEVIKVSVPATLNNDRIAQLLVQRGDRVATGQVLAVMDSRDRLQKPY